MPSDPSREPTESELSRSNLPTDVPPQSSMSASHSRAERFQAWFLTNTLQVEILLTTLSVAVWIIALPIMIFGSLTALGGDTSILSAGATVVAAGFFGIIVLAVWVLVRTSIEVRNQGLPFVDTDNTWSIAYDGIQSLKAVTAGIFLLSLLAYIVLSLAVQSGPTLVFQLLGVGGVLLPVTVFLHGIGAFIGYILNLG